MALIDYGEVVVPLLIILYVWYNPNVRKRLMNAWINTIQWLEDR